MELRPTWHFFVVLVSWDGEGLKLGLKMITDFFIANYVANQLMIYSFIKQKCQTVLVPQMWRFFSVIYNRWKPSKALQQQLMLDMNSKKKCVCFDICFGLLFSPWSAMNNLWYAARAWECTWAHTDLPVGWMSLHCGVDFSSAWPAFITAGTKHSGALSSEDETDICLHTGTYIHTHMHTYTHVQAIYFFFFSSFHSLCLYRFLSDNLKIPQTHSEEIFYHTHLCYTNAKKTESR